MARIPQVSRRRPLERSVLRVSCRTNVSAAHKEDHIVKKMAIHACVAGFLAAGCGSNSTPGFSGSAGSALSADGGQQGTAPQTVGAAADPGKLAVSSTCTTTAAGN